MRLYPIQKIDGYFWRDARLMIEIQILFLQVLLPLTADLDFLLDV